MKTIKTLIENCKDIQEWIIESEMGGDLDKTDPFYPAYEQLGYVIEKLEEEDGL